MVVGLTGGSVSLWVYLDATARQLSWPVLWAALSGPVLGMLLYYLAVTRPRHERVRRGGRRERLAGATATACLTAMIAAAVIAPPDPFTQVRYWIGAVVVAAPPAYYLVYREQYLRVLDAVW